MIPLLAALIFINAFLFGSASALDKKNFLTVPQTKEAVLNIYGSNAVLAPYEGHTLSNKFRIINLYDNPDVRFELRSIGPLRPDKVQR